LKLLTIYEQVKGRPLVILGAVLAVVILVFTSGSASAQDKTIITIHDGQAKKSFVTEASVVSEVLQRADVAIGENDLVEPGLDETVEGGAFSINIYRSRMITVIDEGTRTTVSTAYRSPEAIAEAAGLTVYPEDEFTFVRVDDFLGGTVGMELIVNRASEIDLILYGTVAKVRTQAENVGDFLNGKGVVLAESDVVEPGLNTVVTNGMRVAVARVGTEVVAQEEVVAYGREVINDPNAPIGSERVKTPGVDGKSLSTYEITLRDGVEVGRVKLQQVVIVEARNEVVIIGAQEVDISGDKLDWMEQAGIPQSDWPYVDSIVSKESQWKYQVWNTLGSGAYGLCQALPGSKMESIGTDWETNPVTQLKWCDNYAKVRYGSWAEAFVFWQSNYWW